jgi:lysophospholipase L1-like esterase
MRFRVSHLGNLLLLVVAVTIAFACGEILLRVAKPQVFPVHAQGMYVEDSSIGYLLKPGFADVIERSEFVAPFSVNGAGLRGPALRAPQENSFRILVLGDSQAFGFGTRDEETFAVHLEKLLFKRMQNRDPQVLNAGVPGFGTADQLAFLKAKGPEFKPDLVVVQFLSVNDILESRYPAATWAAVEDGWLISRHNKDDGEGEGHEETAPLDLAERIRLIKRESHLISLVSNSLGYLAVRLGLIDQIDTFWGEDFAAEDGERTFALLVEIAEEADQLGAASLFLYTTAKNYILSADYELPRSGLVVRDAAAAARVPWIDATPFLRRQPNKTDLFYRLDGHWSPQGHRAIAELLADEILDLGLTGAAEGQ